MKIFWTPQARHTYFKVLDHLEKTWTEKEIQNFINKVDILLGQPARSRKAAFLGDLYP